MDTHAPARPGPGRLTFALQVALAAAGVYVSLLLMSKHAASEFGRGGDTGLCTSLAIFSCEAAAKSEYSKLFGVPIAVFGAAYYAGLLLLLPLGRFGGRGFARVVDVVFGTSTLAVLASLFLLGISLFVIGKLCPLCMGLYVVDLGLFVSSWLTHPAGRKGAFGAALRLPVRAEAWILFGLVALATWGFQGLYVGEAKAARAERRAPGPESTTPVAVDTSGSPARGPADAPVTVVEFSDFQCPYCRLLKESLDEAAARHGGVRLVFVHFPMDDACNPLIKHKFHENACGAARAAICAEKQGRFWEMYDELFGHQKDLERDKLADRAAAVGLDAAAFQACLDAPETTARLQRDAQRGADLKLEGTPTWYVNGLRYVGARKPDDLFDILSQAAPPRNPQPASQPE